MQIRVEHTTSFTYAEPISEAYTELRVRPLSAGGQHCTTFRLVTDPPGVRVRNYLDRLGNHVQHLEVLEDHDRISITALSEVSTAPEFSDSARDPSPLQRYDYLAATEYAPFSEPLLELSAYAEGQGTETERAVQVMQRVRGLLVYETGATNVMTRADSALALGRGVCQDFAHVMLAACRRAGIASRYVSGYLYDAQQENEVVETHAWVDVLDSERGWVSLDPTHDREQTEAYVRVAVGRDYGDVPPTRGVWKGTTEETLDVAVRIAAL
jgi:transglutaminase-like putative cysteine protease